MVVNLLEMLKFIVELVIIAIKFHLQNFVLKVILLFISGGNELTFYLCDTLNNPISAYKNY